VRVLDLYRTWNELDMETLAPFYSKAPDTIIFNDVEPANLKGWKRFRDAEVKIMARVSHWKVTPKDLKISLWGKVALSTATPRLVGESKAGRKYNVTMLHTAVWERKGDSWLIIHEHWSIPLPSP
jgi:ketosteroid isomerase-like protein